MLAHTPVSAAAYVGRLAPSPTGFLHAGHARTFGVAAARARAAGGRLWLRIDDLDRARCRPEFGAAAEEDLRWLGLEWSGAPHVQSTRVEVYRETLRHLHAAGLIYPCDRSRKELAAAAASAPHEGPGEEGAEPLYPRVWRPAVGADLPPLVGAQWQRNWRLRVPDDVELNFQDGALGTRRAVAGVDFGDFLVWRRDDLPSYQLATVADDIALGVTEVVRGEDLVKSTFRQVLLFRALGAPAPAWWHCPLVRDAEGVRLAKRHDARNARTRS
jgi:glutamyl/glutaminyl-tRNA synthetase